MQYYLKIDNDLYEADFSGRINDKEWDNRSSKTITLNMSYGAATTLLHDDVEWHIYRSWMEKRQKVDPETGEPIWDEEGNPVMEDVKVEEDYDNSEYSMLGDVVVHNDGTVSVKMGKPTDLEEAYEILYGGN